MTWNGKRFDWINVAYFTALHLGALGALFSFSWPAFLVFLMLCWVSAALGIGVTYHRLLTHRGFKTPKVVEYLGALCGMLASEGGPISWVAMHRAHHQLSDRPGRDLHTPNDGFWWSHIGWVLCHLGVDRRAFEQAHAPEMVADPVHRFLNRFPLVALSSNG